MASDAIIANSFTGSYSYMLDAKGRVNIPAKMRKVLSPENDRTFVVTRGPDLCIVLYPAEVWKDIQAKLIELNKGRALSRHFTRNIVRHAETVQYDHQGRVALPTNLIEYAGISRSVEIVGMIKYIEIWDQKRLEELNSQFDGRQEELEIIASEINL